MSISLLWSVGKVAMPLMAQRAIDQGFDPFSLSTTVSWSLGILAVGVLVAIVTGVRRYAAFKIALRSEADLRHRLVAHLQRLHFAYHDGARTGELMSRANVDVEQIRFMLVFTPVSGANLVMFALVSAALFLIHVQIAVIALISLPLLAVASARFARRMHPVSLNVQEELAEVSRVTEESLSGIRVLKGFGTEEVPRTQMAAAAEDVLSATVELGRLRSIFVPLLELLPTLGLVGMLWVGGRAVVAGDLTVGELVAVNFLVLQVINPMRWTGMLIARASRASASARRILDVLDAEPTIRSTARAAPLPSGPGRVEFEDVSFAYEDVPVLDGLNLVVPGGTSIALVGGTGSGKSTVARLIPRFYDVDRGAVRIDGCDVREAELSDVRRSTGVVFEETFLFSATIRDNIAFADIDVPDEQIVQAARLAGAHEFISALPGGYGTVLGEHGYSLSGGQRQRLAIARAIVSNPRVLILDDATSSVDPAKEHEIAAALRQVMEDRTTIIIAHRPATIALADIIAVVRGGQVVAQGTHEELVTSSEDYRHVLAAAGVLEGSG